MAKLTPTLVICAVGALVAAALLALPPTDTTAQPVAPTSAPSAPPGTVAPVGSAPAGSVAAPAVTLVVEAFAFGPTTLTVSAGATIDIVNRDSIEHTITADDGTFDQFVEAGGSTTFAAPTTPGTYTYFCRIHPAMTAVLIVT